jgi:hypothetical protein
MYALPVNTESARVEPAQARTDLVDIMRMSLDHICTAIGVPSSLLFEARFAGQSTAQLSLLNSTVQQLGRKVDSVLTAVYNDIYGDGGMLQIELSHEDEEEASLKTKLETISQPSNKPIESLGAPSSSEDIELVTTTAPMSAATEVLALFTGGLADFESAAPLALHSVGLSAADIEAALDRNRTKEKEQKKQEEAAIRAAGAGKPVPPEAGAAGVALASSIQAPAPPANSKSESAATTSK